MMCQYTKVQIHFSEKSMLGKWAPRTWTEKGQIGKTKVNDPLKQAI